MLDDDDDDQEFKRQCHDCGIWSPPTRTQHTLISSRFGWRLTRTTSDEGKLVVEWRCPSCHARKRASSDKMPSVVEPPPSSKKGE